MKTLIDQSGLVAEGDYLSLSDTLTIRDSYLIDHVIGAKHKLHRKAIKIIQLLEQPIPLELWHQYAISQKMNDANMLEIIIFLNSIGALNIKRATHGRLKSCLVYCRRLSKGLMPIKRGRRWPTNIMNTNRAILMAMLPLFWATCLTGLLAYGTNINLSLIVAALLIFLSSIWFSTVIHEQTHSFIISHKTNNHVIMQRGLRFGILHRKLPNRIELMSALSGPMVGAAASLVYSVLTGLLSGELYLFGLIGGLVACFQLTSLLPNYGDGRVLWNNLRGLV